MSANVEAMIREGINAYRAGNHEESRTLLLKAVELDEQNEQAWMWLSAVVDTVEDQQTCLENVLSINPNNEKAKQGLRILSQKAASNAAVNTPPASKFEEDDLFANISFTQPTSASSAAGPFSAPDMPEEEELPSLDWDIPATETSSPSSFRPVKEPTSRDYDDWVAGLNLRGGTEPEPVIPASNPIASPSSPFLMNDNDNLFGFDEDTDLPAAINNSTMAGPFDMTDDFEEPDAYQPEAISSRSFASSPSPSFSPLRDSDDELLGDIENDDLMDDDLLEDYDQAEMADLDPQEFFKHIPAEIAPTRLPGVNERYPVLAIIGLLVLFVSNGAAIYLLFQTLLKA